jgi:osmotically-inducible protein OsmY
MPGGRATGLPGPVCGQRKTDTQIHHDVLDELERDSRVDVDNGVVTLEGTVHSWAERTSVVAAARFAPGVEGVEDRLVVEPA